MLSNPSLGDRVRIHYGKHYAAMMPYHGCEGVVEVAGRARKGLAFIPYVADRKLFRKPPRNHGVIVDGKMVVIPSGNLYRIK